MTVALVEEQLMKSRSRVRSYGEVFTPRHMVDRMLDLVRDELETGPGFVDKTFLEPAAGDGNFLVAILQRKLRAIENRYPAEAWPRESLFALASIYGIELLEDNHRDAKSAMLENFVGFHAGHEVPCGPKTKLYRAASFLIDTNIVRGNALTGRGPDGQDIQLSWWNRVADIEGLVEREPFTLTSLREQNLFSFAAREGKHVSPIDQVHNEVNADG